MGPECPGRAIEKKVFGYAFLDFLLALKLY
jgi:hypothetical protein